MREELLANKEKAFQFILPKESMELDLKREELAFFTNQCWEEIKRVGFDNGKLLREHFRNMAQIQCSNLNKNHIMWADFLSHFSEVYISEDLSRSEAAPKQPDSSSAVPPQASGFLEH
eukprot:CAMPEP_0202960008 /NCGR_PEP_ID=MMETSP1396-20130829/4192_1 /ASSEMBLY_ACC=CAM_ASM_000872 /TAXON_ID= /ORGANISM="Pseudokeronopsis sp., Strain Brazil" /LENGTH=117 /DNA_ID=CAMNT_0049678959 /DNA_START=1308 /DNA_END=1657 /DNA_ORIENTATION=+